MRVPNPAPCAARSLPLLAALALAACGDAAPTSIDQAWIRISPNADRPSAGYFVAHGGDTGGEIRGVLADAAQRIEMHETVAENGVMKMKPVSAVSIPAKGTVSFAPGGKHLMLWGVNESALASGKLTLTFLMANGDRLLVDAAVQKAGAGGGAMAGMGGEHAGH